MKAFFRLIILAMLLPAFSSCMYRDVDWDYDGWSEVKNETSAEVTFTSVFMYYGGFVEKVETISPGETLIQYNYVGRPESVTASDSVSIKLQDGTEIVCKNGSDDSWSSRFYGNRERHIRTEWDRSDIMPVKHEITVDTYHIDDELVSLWRQAH